MNPIAKHYMKVRFQKRVAALKKAGIPVTQKTVYDESIQVGVPVPQFGKDKHNGQRQADHEVNKLTFVIDFLKSGILELLKSLFHNKTRPMRKTLTKTQAKFSVGLGLFFAVLGLIGCVYCVHVFAKVHDAKQNWPRVDGVITHSGWTNTRHGAGRHHATSRYHDIRYEYTVGDVKYTGDKVGLWTSGGRGPGASRAREIVRRYNEGDQVVVHVNPRTPSDALLEPGSVPWYWLSFPGALGVLCLFGGTRQFLLALPIAMGKQVKD